jgi:hypothetical protein
MIDGEANIKGHIAPEHGFMLQNLLDSGLELLATCNFDTEKPCKTTSRKTGLPACKLDIAVYGPYTMLGEIGEWFEENDVYLQDPRICLRDAKYCNPQRLFPSSLGEFAMVSSVVTQVSRYHIRLRDITDDDFLDKYLGSKIVLEETDQPSAVRTNLKRYVVYCCCPTLLSLI